MTVVEAVLMGSVMLAALALTLWFFLSPARRSRTVDIRAIPNQ